MVSCLHSLNGINGLENDEMSPEKRRLGNKKYIRKKDRIEEVDESSTGSTLTDNFNSDQNSLKTSDKKITASSKEMVHRPPVITFNQMIQVTNSI